MSVCLCLCVGSCEHPEINLVSFTGGTVTGRKVAATAAPMVSIRRQLHARPNCTRGGSFLSLLLVCVPACVAAQFKKLSLELGGKNATIVFADCDFKTTVSGAVRAAFTNQGQVCLAGSRIFVEESIYQQFVQAMLQEIKEVSAGAAQRKRTRKGRANRS